jgi:hypothetical protein
MRHSIERSSASVPLQHDLFWAAFITNTVGLDFSMPDEVFGTHRRRFAILNVPRHLFSETDQRD